MENEELTKLDNPINGHQDGVELAAAGMECYDTTRSYPLRVVPWYTGNPTRHIYIYIYIQAHRTLFVTLLGQTTSKLLEINPYIHYCNFFLNILFFFLGY